MQKILIDTSIIIDFLRQKDKSKTYFFYFARNNYQLNASILTHAESYAGKSIWESEAARKALEVVLSNIKIILLDEEISKQAGQISAKYDLDIVDSIIGATALLNGLNLATLNTKDFEKIEELKLN